ncbi:F-type conjugal transfer pilus assembly protein TraB [Escherichia marmotae]|uniref:F-type conjugal transfer pilus assembly protein TraB n=1 Tax=Escherichia marmotae TaxID=1499973 RepID=UPI0015D4DD3A|nr:F-type conjugal transfer pilus assembly protein TraB [Escherichia marmotae]MDQ9239099.1 F-type conjugal transfer pilus assembly protein TraB [Escherichia marmotae]MDQ9243878.1 F-type conjugal transfer pilus assembly protein TraB [Escherichia marmotae]MDQ9277394.1 F-type conjugal transfer pilus assembly protein TraB [Escherichia marmotae]HBH7804434.1 F-type conjugal transfer pilus assembly protein TraB [Escherichia coli]
MANINQLVRRKQNLRMALIGLGISAVGGAAWYLSSAQHAGKAAQAQQQKAPPPNMTGVVSQTFDKKVSDAAVADIQHTASEAEKKLKAFESRLAKMEQREQDYRAKIEEQENELAILRAEQEAMKENSAPELPAGQPAPSFGPGAAVPPPTTFYPPGSGNENVNLAPVTQYQVTPKPEKGLSSITVDYGEKSAVSNKPPLPYIPSASFAPAVVIEGADANASVTGNSDPSPMQFRLTGLVRMPNDKTYDLTGCMVTAGAYGDISSERALIRTDRLSCHKNGHVIDMPFKGHVSFKGKNGIKGEPVMRNGKIIGWAFAAGAVDGIGSGVAKIGQETPGAGAVASVSGSSVMNSALGGGASQVGKTLSDYYIKRAEQYHPVIPVGAGTEVTVVFQEGFQLKYTDEDKASTPARQAKAVVDNGIQVSQQMLQELNLGDTVPAIQTPK